MKSIAISLSIFVSMLALAIWGGTSRSAASAADPVTRTFEFNYLTRIPAASPGAKTSRVWIPVPQSDRFQTISDLKIDSPYPFSKRRDPECYSCSARGIRHPVASKSDWQVIALTAPQ